MKLHYAKDIKPFTNITRCYIQSILLTERQYAEAAGLTGEMRSDDSTRGWEIRGGSAWESDGKRIAQRDGRRSRGRWRECL